MNQTANAGAVLTAPGRPAAGLPRNREIRKTLVLLSHRGMHCRPASLLARTLEEYNCRATVEVNGLVVNARSVLGLLSLAAGYGTRLTFALSGPQAREALAAVQHLFDDNFSEAYEPEFGRRA